MRFVAGGFADGRVAARWQAALGALGPVAVALLLPDPRVELALLRDTRPDVVLGAAAVLATTLVVWALVAWAAIVGCAAIASRLPGAAGRIGRRALLALTPSVFRRVVVAAAGLSLAAGLGACGSSSPPLGSAASSAGAVVEATSDPTTSAHEDLLVDLDWPLAAVDDTGPAVPTGPTEGVGSAPVVPPAAAEPPASAAPSESMPPQPTDARPDGPGDPAAAGDPAPAGGASADPVVVHRGDSLWAIAAAHLPDDASPAQIDASWREWYTANRDIIGSDPNLVIPGQRLSSPASRSDAPPAPGPIAGPITAPETTSAPSGDAR